jgi:hypothetical protein
MGKAMTRADASPRDTTAFVPKRAGTAVGGCADGREEPERAFQRHVSFPTTLLDATPYDRSMVPTSA